MYSMHNKRKSLAAERLIRTLKNKIDKLPDIVHEYNKKYHTTIKRNPVDVKPSSYFDFDIQHNKGNPKFKVIDHVRILKYKNIFAN